LNEAPIVKTIIASCWFILVLGAPRAHPALFAQEGTFSLNLSVGLAHLQLDQVDEDNQRDVEGWNHQGVFIDPFPSIKNAFMLSLKGVYRYDRDVAFSLAISDGSREVSTSYTRPEQTLTLIRSVGFTHVTLGVLYHFPLFYGRAEGYVGGDVGVLKARAQAEAYGSRMVKIIDSTQTFVTADTKGTYRASKTVADVTLGATVRLFEPVFLRTEAQYTVGKVGKMDGRVTRMGTERDETTSIEFNYSGFLFTLGVGVQF
jgi:hypothetical protein